MNSSIIKGVSYLLLYILFPAVYMLSCNVVRTLPQWYFTSGGQELMVSITTVLLFLINGILVSFIYLIIVSKKESNMIYQIIGLVIAMLYLLIFGLPANILHNLLVYPVLSIAYVKLYCGITIPGVFFFTYLLKIILLCKSNSKKCR